MLFSIYQITILCLVTRKFFKFSVQKIFSERFSCIEVICYSKADMITKGKLSKKTVEYNIESLKKKGVLKRVGPAKGGYWKVIKS